MAHVWKLYGNEVDGSARPAKEQLLSGNCTGVVLDIGAGHGHTALYLDPTKVTKYVALEPNFLMHAEIRATAAKQGFTEAAGTLLIVPYGAEQTALIRSALGYGGAHAGTVDTLVSILSLCSVPDPQRTLAALVRDVLRPGGTLLFYEHVLSPLADVAWWQRFWTPLWSRMMDGCRLDRPTHVWVEKMDAWAEGSVWGKPDEPEEHLTWHRVGRFVKKTV
uniref:Cytochrome P450 monooxygenase CYP52X1 n=1 Tax=Ganoderma boninense TaxID=34458 RepID=A0A5K1JVZ8_9APHY|nr:Cytochrome P450 monooxygenase CYP52X1 [Ganoderma boninense]